jgi:activator of HSP90 ATPase
MDSKKHSAFTGDKAVIGKKVGDRFTIFNKYGSGKNLLLIKNTLIVQSWRSGDFKKEDIDSVFTLHFIQRGRDVVAEMTHANIPVHAYAGIKSGWNQYYWEPWRKYLKMRSK